MDYKNRLWAIRKWLTDNALDAFIIPHEDEFLGEYIPAHNERLHWATGFTGSAGVAIITAQKAAIFIDGRYTVQAKKQVSTELFEQLHLIENPPLQWLSKELNTVKLALDPRLHSATWLETSRQSYPNIEFVCINENPIDANWHDRPPLFLSKARLMALSLVGQSSIEKREQIGQILQSLQADIALISQLDSICWLLNIRGQDVARLPVLLSSAIIDSQGQVTFFIDPSRLPDNFLAHVGEGVSVQAPENFSAFLALQKNKKILIDPNSSNAWTSQLLAELGIFIIHDRDPCALLKAAKNATEIQGMKACHVRDGVAVSRFLAWVDKEVLEGRLHNEDTLANKLYELRKQDDKLMDLSFDTISAAAENAAMCHYRHQDQAKPGIVKLNNLYLVDSGGQYLDGTTDITRTIAIGEASEQMKRTFTLVLKGHIALASAYFPKGTTGSQLDALARQYLWLEGYDYDHGTGHGVGHFLNVHEGPQRISKVGNNVALLPGMVLSNEPAYYRADHFGIRIENLEVVTEKPTSGDMPMLGFESLTRAPIDTHLIDKSLLTQNEITWLNDYHQKVWQALHTFLNDEDKSWLLKATAPVSN
jgi:Xaa-Pro aminopeptidase